jgi:hypothetical protein
MVRTTDDASTNKFQQDRAAQEQAMVAKANDLDGPSNPLNTIDGNSGPAYSFAKLNASDLELTGASFLIANRSEQAHYEVILWTSLYPLPEDTTTLNDYYDFSNMAQESYISLASYLLAPATSGNVTINSTDASTSPLISLPVRSYHKRHVVSSITRPLTILSTVLRGRQRHEHSNPLLQAPEDFDRARCTTPVQSRTRQW